MDDKITVSHKKYAGLILEQCNFVFLLNFVKLEVFCNVFKGGY